MTTTTGMAKRLKTLPAFLLGASLVLTLAPAAWAGPGDITQDGWTTLGTRAFESMDEPQPLMPAPDNARWSDYDRPADYPRVKRERVQYITMADGTQLAAYLTLPADWKGKPADGPFPTILVQTAYNGGSAGQFVRQLGGPDRYMVRRGYASLVVDVRGTGQSSGLWQAFGEQEQADYGQVVDWITDQPWSNGDIGLYGISYGGITATLTATQNNPAVKALFPIVPIGDGYRDTVFVGGQANSTFIPAWFGLIAGLGALSPSIILDPTTGVPRSLDHLLNVFDFQVPTFFKALEGDPAIARDGDFWKTRSPLEVEGQIDVPTFIVGGLHDLFQRSEPIAYETIKPGAATKLLIGPWAHVQAAVGVGLPRAGLPRLNRIELRWFDQYLMGRDVGADTLPNVTQFYTGQDAYVTARDWPHPEATADTLYLQSDESLSETQPAAEAEPRETRQHPVNGLCSISLTQWSAGLTGLLPIPCFKYSNSTERSDLVYTTAPMTEDTYINGPIQANIWLSTTAKDVVLSVRVDDENPMGIAKSLTNGVQIASIRQVDPARSRYLDGQMIQPWFTYTEADEQPYTPGDIVKVPVEIFPTSAMIAKGHRLRIAVGSGNLAAGIPPLPTAANSAFGRLSVYSDAEHASNIVIPSVPADAITDHVVSD